MEAIKVPEQKAEKAPEATGDPDMLQDAGILDQVSTLAHQHLSQQAPTFIHRKARQKAHARLLLAAMQRYCMLNLPMPATHMVTWNRPTST